MEDLLSRSQVPRRFALSDLLARRSDLQAQARTETKRDQMTKKFQPTEVWVLPARRTRDAVTSEPIATAITPVSSNARAEGPDIGRGRVVLQTGFGLCVSIVLAACGSRDNRPTHVGPPLGSTHVSQGPSDPTVPPPDAPDYEQPSPGLPISTPVGPAPTTQPAPADQQPAQAPTSDQQQPGVFSPPPPSENQPDASQPQIPQPAPPSTTPLPQQ
jgi:hypothetical protein